MKTVSILGSALFTMAITGIVFKIGFPISSFYTDATMYSLLAFEAFVAVGGKSVNQKVLKAAKLFEQDRVPGFDNNVITHNLLP